MDTKQLCGICYSVDETNGLGTLTITEKIDLQMDFVCNGDNHRNKPSKEVDPVCSMVEEASETNTEENGSEF